MVLLLDIYSVHSELTKLGQKEERFLRWMHQVFRYTLPSLQIVRRVPTKETAENSQPENIYIYI